MKRFLPFILISSVILQFFAPFAVQINSSNINYIVNQAEADGYNFEFDITPKTTSSDVSLEIKLKETSDIRNILRESSGLKYYRFYISAILYNTSGEEVKKSKPNEIQLTEDYITNPLILKFNNLDEDTKYSTVVKVNKHEVSESAGGTNFSSGLTQGIFIETAFEKKIETPTSKEGETNTLDSTNSGTLEGEGVKGSNLPDCGFRNIGGCIARIFYYVLFVPTSFLFGLAGKVMDFTIMYSVSDSSYRTPFVSEGWKVVRDLCNMFFIFILLYIAITTILDVGGSKNKSQVVNVVIIGLFINFSLFATHLIIDASNIMARVFYNPKVLVIGEKDETSGEVKSERDSETGTIQLSQAIVSKINPQRLLEKDNQNVASNQASKITKDSKITTNEDTEDQGITAGTFILVTLMASIVNFIGMMTFLTISLSFIGRVVGLWVAMVLSPLAFLSYTVPETKKWDYVGWSSWWSETVKTAFMAPVFVFFMYIIVMFLESGIISNVAGDGSGLTNFNKILSVIIPFIVIIVLLKQAEKISTKLAGQVAGTVTSAVGNVGAKVGGLALGGALGAGAFAMRSTMGKMGAGLANSEKLIDAEKKGGISGWGARQLRNVGSFTGKSSFDVRSTKVGQTAGKQMGVEGLGKGKAGGYVEYQNSIEKRKTARADTFKSSDAKAAEQDAAAKDYNDKYQKSLYEMKKDKINLSDADFEAKYNNKKKSEITDKSFNDDYKNKIKEQEKSGRIQELARENKAFDQKEQDKFEKEYTEKHKNDGKSSEEIYRDRVKTYKESVKRDGVWGANDSTMARIDKSLKDKSKDPNAEKPLTHKENFLAERNKLKAKNKIDEVENTITKMEDVKKAIGEEMEDINKELADVANTLGQTIAPENINKEHIKQAVEKIRGDVSGAEARIISLNNILAQNPGSQVAQRELIEANKAKRDGEAKIKNMSNVLERKNKNKEKETSQLSNIERQQSIIQKQKEIIEKEQETIDRYEREQTKKP